MVLQNYQKFIVLTSNMIYIVALGVGLNVRIKSIWTHSGGGGRLFPLHYYLPLTPSPGFSDLPTAPSSACSHCTVYSKVATFSVTFVGYFIHSLKKSISKQENWQKKNFNFLYGSWKFNMYFTEKCEKRTQSIIGPHNPETIFQTFWLLSTFICCSQMEMSRSTKSILSPL